MGRNPGPLASDRRCAADGRYPEGPPGCRLATPTCRHACRIPRCAPDRRHPGHDVPALGRGTDPLPVEGQRRVGGHRRRRREAAVRGLRRHVLRHRQPCHRRGNRRFEDVETRADDPALIFYTSGTTGRAKGIVHAHRTLFGHNEFEYCHQIGDRDVFYGAGDWAWSLAKLMGPLRLGATQLVFRPAAASTLRRCWTARPTVSPARWSTRRSCASCARRSPTPVLVSRCRCGRFALPTSR